RAHPRGSPARPQAAAARRTAGEPPAARPALELARSPVRARQRRLHPGVGVLGSADRRLLAEVGPARDVDHVLPAPRRALSPPAAAGRGALVAWPTTTTPRSTGLEPAGAVTQTHLGLAGLRDGAHVR